MPPVGPDAARRSAKSPRARENTLARTPRPGDLGRASSASYSQCGRVSATVAIHGRGPLCFAWPRTDGEPSCVSEGTYPSLSEKLSCRNAARWILNLTLMETSRDGGAQGDRSVRRKSACSQLRVLHHRGRLPGFRRRGRWSGANPGDQAFIGAVVCADQLSHKLSRDYRSPTTLPMVVGRGKSLHSQDLSRLTWFIFYSTGLYCYGTLSLIQQSPNATDTSLEGQTSSLVVVRLVGVVIGVIALQRYAH